jgi:MoxR-like ATPase
MLEGVPGLAKTLMISTLAKTLDLSFSRIQFTPDLMPADVTGTEIIEEDRSTGHRDFRFMEGPLFANVILADEINRTPPKTQAALLEAMQEKRVSSGGEDYKLDEPFFVLATQNPIEQEGTYPLPEAQLDRFLMHVRIDYPDGESERKILHLARDEATTEHEERAAVEASIDQETIFAARKEVLSLHLAPALEQYLIQLVLATRQPDAYGEDLARWLQYGASPRATIALDRCARAHAWLEGRDFVSPEDIQNVAPDVLRHRLILDYEAEALGIDTDTVIDNLLQRVAVP